jgi:hypothetical protein
MINLFFLFYNFLKFSRIFLYFWRFSQFVKKIIQTGPCPTHGGLVPESQRWDRLDFSEFDPPRSAPYKLWTVDRADP